jgi:hypothetical protein
MRSSPQLAIGMMRLRAFMDRPRPKRCGNVNADPARELDRGATPEQLRKTGATAARLLQSNSQLYALLAARPTAFSVRRKSRSE